MAGMGHNLWRVTSFSGLARPAGLVHCRVGEPGGYWRPIPYVVVETVEVGLAKACSVHQRPGKKTDKADASWLADLLAHSLITPSLIRFSLQMRESAWLI